MTSHAAAAPTTATRAEVRRRMRDLPWRAPKNGGYQVQAKDARPEPQTPPAGPAGTSTAGRRSG
jgi:hypothetical protein